MSPDMHSDAGRLRQMLARCGLLITDRKRGGWMRGRAVPHVSSSLSTAEFSSKDIVQDLNRLLRLESGASSAALRELLPDPSPALLPSPQLRWV